MVKDLSVVSDKRGRKIDKQYYKMCYVKCDTVNTGKKLKISLECTLSFTVKSKKKI